MKAVMVTAPRSGSGKTTISMGIVRALRNAGKNVIPFKTGPDYIDRAFLEKASGNSGGNLDIFLQGVSGMREALAFFPGECAVIEGAMGFFDGIHNTYTNSSYHISKELGVPAVLIYAPEGEMFSSVPKIKGMVEFEDARIKAVILNRVTEKTYLMLKQQIEEYTGVRVIGFIPQAEEFALESRHLGLVQSVEVDALEDRIEHIARIVREKVDMNAFIRLMSPVDVPPQPAFDKRPVTVAVAKDKAFTFYYSENLRMLEEACNVVYFSPLYDPELPPCDLVYLGGGYPEVFRDQLALNTSMLNSMRRFAEDGGFIYAECGGFMYLCESIEGAKMTGIFGGQCRMTGSLQRFGYVDLRLEEDCLLGRKGDCLTAHEFHKSAVSIPGSAVYAVSKAMGNKSWYCGYRYKNVLGGYPHIHFLGNRKAFANLLDCAEGVKSCI